MVSTLELADIEAPGLRLMWCDLSRVNDGRRWLLAGRFGGHGLTAPKLEDRWDLVDC